MKKKRGLKLWHKVIIGMLLGIMVGAIFGEQASIMKPVGIIFTNMLKMIVVPLIFFAVLYGITSIDDANTFGRLGSKALIIYSLTTIFAVNIGLVFANIFEPGIGVNIKLNHSDTIPALNTQVQTLSDVLLNIIPSNPIQAMASGNTLQVVVFAFFTGFAMILAGEKARDARNLVVSCTHVVFKMVELVIRATPYGVFAIMSWIIGEYGFGLMFGLAKLVGVVLAALLLQYTLFGIMLIIFGRLNPIPFYKKMITIQTLAFATSSSKATLATAMQELQAKMGVSKRSASFILPLGAAMNMDATAIYLGVCTVFFAQMTGVDLTAHQYLIIIIASTIGSIGAAGFPGGGIVMMSMVLSSVGLPLEGISLILGIDRILDMLRTTVNITGDCTVTIIVDKMEGSLDEKKYYKNHIADE